MQIRNHYFFAFFLLLFFPAFTAAQIRLAPSRNRSSIFSRTTTKSPNGLSPKPPVTKEIEKPSLTLPARTGQFFVYAFSYKDFDKPSIENRTNAVRDRFGFGARPTIDHPGAKYDYTAAIHGRPDLPSWLNLAATPSDDEESNNRAFLYGTPEKDEFFEDIMILARNLATNDVLQKLIRIHIQNDKRYSAPVKQMAELWIENYDTWELLSSASASSAWSSDLSNVRPANVSKTDEENGDEDTLLDELRYAISRTFRGRGVRPYIRDLKPATQAGARTPPSKSDKVGFVVYVATAHGFPIGLQHLSLGLTSHPDKCNRTEIIPPDVYFTPVFTVNWCRFRVYNVTTPNPNDATLLIDGQHIRGSNGLTSFDDVAPIAEFETNQPVRHYEPVARQRDYSWEWVMVAVVPLAILLVLVLILSAVFFGCREGQHWRDYKTPREQLNEYVNLRRTQHRLRMLSQQRQSVDILDATEEPSSPMPPIRRPVPPASPSLSLGKQTVAQAAAVKGSNIELYKDSDSFDEREQLLAGPPRGGTYPKQHYQSKDNNGQPGQRRTSYDDQRMLITRDSSV